jgi:uncharacterized membrane protein
LDNEEKPSGAPGTSLTVNHPAKEEARPTITWSASLQYQTHLPPPQLLREYEELIPGVTKDLHQNYLEESKHRRVLENWTVKGGVVRSFLGVLSGLASIFVVFYLAWLLAMSGHETLAGIIATVNIVGIVSVFIFGTRYLNKAKQQANQDTDGSRE